MQSTIKRTFASEHNAGLFFKRDNSLLIRRINLLEQRPTQRFNQNLWNTYYRTISSCFCTSYIEIVITSWKYFCGHEWSTVYINVCVDRVINGLIISEISLVFFVMSMWLLCWYNYLLEFYEHLHYITPNSKFSSWKGQNSLVLDLD